MDRIFLGIQCVMAKQNGAESTRYCGGCHDPISLFSGTKNIFVENLTGPHGYQEGVSCLACHAIRETDLKGNANYTVTQPHEYLWQWATNGVARVVRDFLIRSHPAEHNRLAKRSFKKPEYCAACHKQFIDAVVNHVGWVQLQNQYDNWASSHWNKKGDARKVECRECHMPLVDSPDLRIHGMGAAWGDYDGDGYLGLVVTGYDALRLFHNEAGSGRFTADFDLDGDLDFVIADLGAWVRLFRNELASGNGP